MEFESARLSLRPFARSDLDFLVALHQEPEVVRYFGGKPWPAEVTRRWLEDTLACYRDLEAGQLAVVRKADQRLIGRCGFTPFYVTEQAELAEQAELTEQAELGDPRRSDSARWAPRQGRPELACRHAGGCQPDPNESLTLELGCTLTRDAWGGGFATEAAAMMRDDAFARRGAPRLLAFVDPDNAPSLRAVERLGFVRHGAARVLLGAHLHGAALEVQTACFQLSREQWERRVAS